MSTKNIFFAYENNRYENVDAIKKAANELNKSNKKCKVIRWEDLSVSGKIVSSDILNQIKKCDKFACDLTYLNHNVLFELGYAIAQQKKLKIFLNPSIINAKNNYLDLKIMKNIGFKEFSNAKDISRELQKPTTSEESLLLIEKIIPGYKTIEVENDIFLINLKTKNQAAIDIEDFISADYDKFITNNEDEIDYRPLVWYLNSILKSKIIILHMLGNEKIDFKTTNAEYSLYAGLAFGLGKDILMLAQKPYKAPIDYTDILIEYELSDDCVTKTLKWLENHLSREKEKVSIPEPAVIIPDNNLTQDEIYLRELNLLKLGIGDGVAEKDKNTSMKTFVEIDAYSEANTRRKAIITGRKGSGKTEIFLRLKENLESDKNNFNIIIRPDSEELVSNIEFSHLYNNDRSKKSFLKTVWQYVILSKIFQHIYNNKNSNNKLSENEIDDITNYYKLNEEMFNYNFYSMILYIARNLNDNSIIKDPSLLEKIKQKLFPMINMIKLFFHKTKYQKITILADNLDTGWEASSDLSMQSLMIICLLEYIDELNNFFGDNAYIHSAIFLRKDIYNFILSNSREPDKMIMDAFEINWERFPNLIKKVIDKRILNILDNTENIDKIWQDYFSFKKNVNPFEKIQSCIVKRPRDAIYFIYRLFESAATNNKIRVDDDDFNYALDEYTKYLYGNLIAELKAEFPEIEKILRELQRVYSGILTQFTFISIDNFYKTIQRYINKDEKEKFTKVLMENDYLVAVIKNSNIVICNYDDLIAAVNERKLKIFKKNKILFNMRLIPFAR